MKTTAHLALERLQSLITVAMTDHTERQFLADVRTITEAIETKAPPQKTQFGMNREPTIGKLGPYSELGKFPKDDGKVGLDPPRVHPDMAVELCIHHISLAHMYYQAVPDDENAQLIAEAQRQFLDHHSETYVPPEMAGLLAFAGALLKYYTNLKIEQGD